MTGSAPHPYADALAPHFPSDEEIERLYALQLLDNPYESLSRVSPEIAELRAHLEAAYQNTRDLTATWAAERLRWKRLYQLVHGYCGRRGRAFIDRVNRDARERPTVLFVAPWPNYKFLREAEALRARGVACYLIALRHDHLVIEVLERQEFRTAFDEIHEVRRNPLILLALLRQLRPAVFHVHGEPWTHAVVRTVNEGKRSSACVVELEDVFTVYAERGVMHRVWPKEKVDFAYAMEGHACRHSDGVVYPFAPGVQDELEARHGTRFEGIHFPCYPSPSFTDFGGAKESARDGRLRTVWAGNVWLPNPGFPEELFPSAGLVRTLRTLLDDGIGCEIVIDPGKYADFNGPGWSVYTDLRRYDHFRLGLGVPPAQLSQRINHADFGLQFAAYDPDRILVRPSKLRFQISVKFFAYLEAGLPIVVNSEFAFIADLVERHGIGLAVGIPELASLGERLRSFDREAAVENIRRFNHDHSMHREIERLMAFYERLSPTLWRGSAAGRNREARRDGEMAVALPPKIA